MFNRAIVITMFAFAVMPQSSFATSINIPTPDDIIIGAQNFTSNIIEWFTGTTEAKPYAVQYVNQVYAQTAGSGGEGSMVIYFKETINNGISTGNLNCPSGWSDAFAPAPSYGPHYIGLLAYDWFQDGTGGTGGGFGSPSGGTPPPIPPGPQTGGGPSVPKPWGPSGGSGGGGGNPEINVDPPKNCGGGGCGDDEDPPVVEKPPPEEPPVVPGPGILRIPDKRASGLATTESSFFERFINKAFAAQPANYYISATSIGSDSVCSQSSTEVVPVSLSYLNNLYSPSLRINSNACFTNQSTGITECNRCRVCYK